MTREELERNYDIEDPWGYQSHPDDEYRKNLILQTLAPKRFKRALDICCGEGWITKDLPAAEIHGFEASDQAASRFPPNVKRVHNIHGYYDLIVLTGALYANYNWEDFINIINQHASQTVLLCNIKDREVSEAIERLRYKAMLVNREFQYREFTQKLRLFKV